MPCQPCPPQPTRCTLRVCSLPAGAGARKSGVGVRRMGLTSRLCAAAAAPAPGAPAPSPELSLPQDLITRLVIVSLAMRSAGLVLPCGQGEQDLGVAVLMDTGCLASRGCLGWSLPAVRIPTAWEAGVAVCSGFVWKSGGAPCWSCGQGLQAASSFSQAVASCRLLQQCPGELALPVAGKGHTVPVSTPSAIHHPLAPSSAVPAPASRIFPAKAPVLMAHPHRCQRRFSFSRGTQSALSHLVLGHQGGDEQRDRAACLLWTAAVGCVRGDGL